METSFEEENVCVGVCVCVCVCARAREFVSVRSAPDSRTLERLQNLGGW